MRILNINIAYTLLAAILFLNACEQLEMEQDTAIDDELMWSNPSYVSSFMIDLISTMPSGFNNEEFGWTFYANATDEAENSNPQSGIQNLNTGNWNALSSFTDNIWYKYYSGISKANHFLKKAEGVTYETYAPDKRKDFINRLNYYKSEAKFLRALFYYELIKHYGGVVLIGDYAVVDLDDLKNEAFSQSRSSFAACANYIIAECDSIIINSKLPLLDEGADQGRPNGTAAKALKCKTQLLLASPTYNSEIADGSAKQMEYWQAVATTAQDLCFDKIFSFGPYDVYDGTSPEVILGFRFKSTNRLERANYPIGCEGVNTSGSTNPTHDLAEAYRMKNGLKITHATSGYDPNNPHLNRDERFTKTILINGSDWNERNTEPRKVEAFRGGRDGMDKPYATRTGYYLRKFINPELDLRQGQSSNREWPIFRFADIVLIWAEAMNELHGPSNRGAFYLTSTTIVNQVITRHGGLPELPLTGISKDDLRERIREERFIEFAFEGQRAWDLRRWGIAPEVLSKPVHKVEITPTSDTTYTYDVQKLEDRFFDTKMNLYPIPQRAVNQGITQNPGW